MALRLEVRKGGYYGHEEPTRERSPSRPNQGRDLEEPGFQRQWADVQYDIGPAVQGPESDTWKESQSLGRDDLLLAAKVLGEAHTWIYCHADEEER